jgi:hypothetical protein
VLAIYQLYIKINLISISYVSFPQEKALICFQKFRYRGKKMLIFYVSKVSQSILKSCHESVKSNEAISYVGIPRKVFSGISIDDGNKKTGRGNHGMEDKKIGLKNQR